MKRSAQDVTEFAWKPPSNSTRGTAVRLSRAFLVNPESTERSRKSRYFSHASLQRRHPPPPPHPLTTNRTKSLRSNDWSTRARSVRRSTAAFAERTSAIRFKSPARHGPPLLALPLFAYILSFWLMVAWVSFSNSLPAKSNFSTWRIPARQNPGRCISIAILYLRIYDNINPPVTKFFLFCIHLEICIVFILLLNWSFSATMTVTEGSTYRLVVSIFLLFFSRLKFNF